MAVDIILLLIFVVCVLSGYRKGLILSLCTLLMLALSCLGAAAVQQALTPKVSEWMEPKVTSYLVDVIQDGVEDSTENALEQTGEVGLTIGGKQVTLNDLAALDWTFRSRYRGRPRRWQSRWYRALQRALVSLLSVPWQDW